MDQKQLDDLESEENKEDSSQEMGDSDERSESATTYNSDEQSESAATHDFSDTQEPSEDTLEDSETSEKLEAEHLDEPEVPNEPDATSEEKVNDVNDILENNKDEEEKVEEESDTNPPDEQKECDAVSNPECSGSGDTDSEEKIKEDTWNSDEDDSPKSSTWKYISGVLLILLVAAIYTNGFNFTGAATVSTPLTLIDAEDKILDYVNNNLLQPPFTATVVSSEELDLLFRITLDVTGQKVDSYLTKDGRFFFPQGFDLEAPLDLDLGTPETELVEVSIDDDAVLGNEDAPVTIVEFSDFQCPFCKKGWEAMKQVEEEYVGLGKVKIVFRDFPLGFHSQAKPAAMAAECAHEQGKFWEYHDMLFENQAELNPENYKKWAAELGLDMQQFNTCLESRKYQEEVEKDFTDGQKYGVSGTPAFFVNGKLISGAQPFAAFKQAIEEALNKLEEPQELDFPEEELEEQVEEVADVVEEELAEETEPELTVKEIQITAKKWRFDPSHVEVNQGDQVKLTITSEEIDLNFILSAFGISKRITPDEPVTVEFTADKKGTFDFLCGDYCISKYGTVQGAALKGEIVIG